MLAGLAWLGSWFGSRNAHAALLLLRLCIPQLRSAAKLLELCCALCIYVYMYIYICICTRVCDTHTEIRAVHRVLLLLLFRRR